jgi:hypothetical protein
MRCLIFLRWFACWFFILFASATCWSLIFSFSASVAFSSGIIWRIVSAFSCIIADVLRIMSDWATTASGTADNLDTVSSTLRFNKLHLLGTTQRASKCGCSWSRSDADSSKYCRKCNGSSASVFASDDGLWGELESTNSPADLPRTSACLHSIPPSNPFQLLSR